MLSPFKEDVIPNVVSAEWAGDGKAIFYTVPDSLKRPWQVYSHTIGTSFKNDQLIWQENNHSFFVDVTRTKDKVEIQLHYCSLPTRSSYSSIQIRKTHQKCI